MKSFEIINERYGKFEVSVDEEDYDKVIALKWHIDKSSSDIFYVVGYAGRNNKTINQQLHRFIMKIFDPKIFIDHIDGNGLNNCKSNLRLATNQQNIRNSRMHKDNTSGFKGVSWYKRYKKWRAMIGIDGKVIHLGYFNTPEEASMGYETKAKEVFKEFYKNSTKETENV